MSSSMNPTPPTNNQRPLCDGAWAIPPSPLMLTRGNNYHTCSKCSEPCESPAETIVSNNQGPDELDEILTELWKSGYLAEPDDTAILRAKASIQRLKATWERQARIGGYIEAVGDMSASGLTKRQIHMLVDVKSENFTTYYEYARRIGVTHQSAQQTYAVLVKKGLVPKLEQPNPEQRKT